MPLLTDDIQEKLTRLFVEEGLVAENILVSAKESAAKENKPLFSFLTEQGVIDDELLTHAIAQVSGVPYVNLSNTLVDQSILGLLPEDIAERFMAAVTPVNLIVMGDPDDAVREGLAGLNPAYVLQADGFSR